MVDLLCAQLGSRTSSHSTTRQDGDSTLMASDPLRSLSLRPSGTTIHSLSDIISNPPLPLTSSPPGTRDQHSHTASKITAMPLKHVPASRLFVSEPQPSWFGNPRNELQNPRWDKATSQNWLKSRFHFSFAEYSSRLNSNFGVIRVMNDDFVQPDRGFGTHGHANMEIITYSAGKIDSQRFYRDGRDVGEGKRPIHDCWTRSASFRV